MPDMPKISDSEWPIMELMWERYPRVASEIIDEMQSRKKVRESTIRTFLRRLVDKGAIGYTIDPNNANLFHYHPLVCEQDCIQKENKHFLDLYYNGNTSKMFAALVHDATLSDEEIEYFTKLLERKKEDKQS